ncbi:hypothetical protein ABMA09_15145 [Erwinia rhapontici]|uniref:Uncharacterized protein n=1 Tax=Erwinia rhapontici TaxID=55212 RepID=A0ABM7N2C0_ERWRD|nr:hypothetical protein [Erwinia rhapontici]BCQ35586.1 hypothetical protein ERHA53_29290 [Erwinia rhapontici]
MLITLLFQSRGKPFQEAKKCWYVISRIPHRPVGKFIQGNNCGFIIRVTLAEVVNIGNQVIEIMTTIFNINLKSRIDNLLISFAIFIAILSKKKIKKVLIVLNFFNF